MSIAVLKKKANARAKLTRQNQHASVRGEPFALNVTNRGVVRNTPVMGQFNMSGCCPPSDAVRKSAKPQSYFNFHRRTLGGLGSLSARVVDVKARDKYGSETQMLTFKRKPEFTQKDFIKNKVSKEIRCDASVIKCDPQTKPSGSSFLPSYIEPNCYNNCGKQSKYTKDLGFKSSSDHLQKKLANRKMTGNYEEPLMRGSSSRC